MPEVERVGDLDVAEDPQFQRRAWVVQRVGWALMALVVLAATAGVLGAGPVSRAKATAPDGSLRVEYDRFVRHRAPAEFTVVVTGTGVQGEEVRVAIGQAYLASMQVEAVYPEPDSVEVDGNEDVYVFKTRQQAPVSIVFRVMHDGLGSARGQIRVEGSPPATVKQFVYP